MHRKNKSYQLSFISTLGAGYMLRIRVRQDFRSISASGQMSLVLLIRLQILSRQRRARVHENEVLQTETVSQKDQYLSSTS